MRVPYLKKKPEIKSCNKKEREEKYKRIKKKKILEVLRHK